MNNEPIYSKLISLSLPSKIAIAVSGGRDSLSLLMWITSLGKNIDISVLTVDHKLRKESTQEAELVKTHAKKLGFAHETLVWNHNHPLSRIQEKAREARFNLMIQWCKENHCSTLLMAHHLHDQMETFFMRLSKGSGVKGLTCMKERTLIKGIHIVRPLLEFDPTHIHQIIPEHMTVVEDPSNENNLFERIRYRKMIKELMTMGFDKYGFQKSIQKIQSTDSDIDEMMQKNTMSVILHKTEEEIVLDIKQLQSLPFVIFERLIRALVEKNNGIWQPLKKPSAFEVKNNFAPRYESIKEIFKKIKDPMFRGTTISGYYFSRVNNILKVKIESKIERSLS